jgi:hypothetical protein
LNASSYKLNLRPSRKVPSFVLRFLNHKRRQNRVPSISLESMII